MNPRKHDRNKRILARLDELRRKGRTVEEAEEITGREFYLGRDMIHKIRFDKKYQSDSEEK